MIDSTILPQIITTADPVVKTLFAYKIFTSRLAIKLLGPLADYYGEQIVDLAKKGDKFVSGNMARVISIATKTENKIIKGDSYVSPAIARRILSEAMTSTNYITDLYLGRVLASSKSTNGRDDRGIVFADLISRLSTYQLRAHYILYRTTKNLLEGKKLNASSFHDREKMHIFIPLNSFAKAMDFRPGESETICCFIGLLGHIISGLVKEDLIANDFQFGPMHNEGHIYEIEHKVKTEGGVFTPTMFGMEFFAWANGHPEVDYASFLHKSTKFPSETQIKKVDNAVIVEERILAGN